MRTRVGAGAVLVVTAAVAWVTITVPLAARVLQASIVVSMLYVAYLAWRGSRVMQRALRDSTSAGGGAGMSVGGNQPAGRLPSISLVLPARNEAGVVGEAVRSLRALRYAPSAGSPEFEVLVIDDGSIDGTGERAAAAAAGAAHVRVTRRDEVGPRTKGAALAHAMTAVTGDVVGIVDADTVVEPAFLERVLTAWGRDPGAAALQVSRRPGNASASWLTAAQAEEQLMDMASQCGRWATDGTAELRGNGMFVRRTALDAVGGWNVRALTEDLDLSTRLSAAGYHVALAPEVAVIEEAVESLGALWRQRLRWAEGSLRRLLEHGPRLLAERQPLTRKADFLAFAAEFVVPPLFVTTILASLVTIPLPRPADWTVPASLFAGYGIGAFVLAIGGLSAGGERGPALIGRAFRGALFLSHWLVVVPAALVRIAVGPGPGDFVQTPRFPASADR